jgi:hypothetical protein
LKTCLTSKPVVSFPRKHLQYAHITDAATGDDQHPGGMGAILTQVDKDGKFYVIAYASKKIEKHEKNYTPFLLEMYAAVWVWNISCIICGENNFYSSQITNL